MRTQTAIYRFRRQWQAGQPHANRIIDGAGDRRRHAESAALAHALGAERTRLLDHVDGFVFHSRRNIANTRDLVIGERRVGALAGVEIHALEQREAQLHHRRTGNLRLDNRRIHRPTDIDQVDQARDLELAGFGIDFDFGASGADHPERRRIVGLARGVRRGVGRDIAADADDVAGLHAVFLAEDVGDRCGFCGQADVLGQLHQLVARIFGSQLHRMAHVVGRTRTQRRHVVGRDVGIGMNNGDRFNRNAQRLGGKLRHRGIGTLPHVDGAAIHHAAAVGADIYDGHRRCRRNARLEADGNATAAA